jgi:adenylosuccinate synthase
VTKLDVLGGLDRIRLATAYRREGRQRNTFPAHTEVLAGCAPLYEEYPGWEEDVSGVRRFEDLPREARDYLHAIEEHLSVPVGMVSVGPGRDQVIVR